MKKLLALLLAAIIAVIVSCAALAEVPALSESLLKYAKGALSALASGAYDKLVTSLPFSDVSPSADEWRNLAENSFSDLSGTSPQTKYAVGYWTGRVWKIAAPASEPNSDGVEALVLISEDGDTFTGYACADWGDIQSEYSKSDYVIWKDEYSASTSAVVEVDE